jgi:selenoprotein W-related protein
LTAKLLSKYKQQIEEMKLIPAGGGCFELKADGELLYSKLETGQFPDESSLVKQVGSHLKQRVGSN